MKPDGNATVGLNRGACALLGLLLIWAGCATTRPPRYYTLEMRASGAAKPNVALRVERLRESEPLARKNILIQKTPIQVEYYALDQWAAAPGEMVSQKLESEFGQDASASKTFVMTGVILDFGQVDAPECPMAHAKLDLEFRPEDVSHYDPPALKKTYEATLPAEGSGPGAVVKALSHCLEQIAAQIAVDVNALGAKT